MLCSGTVSYLVLLNGKKGKAGTSSCASVCLNGGASSSPSHGPLTPALPVTPQVCSWNEKTVLALKCSFIATSLMLFAALSSSVWKIERFQGEHIDPLRRR